MSDIPKLTPAQVNALHIADERHPDVVYPSTTNDATVACVASASARRLADLGLLEQIIRDTRQHDSFVRYGITAEGRALMAELRAEA